MQTYALISLTLLLYFTGFAPPIQSTYAGVDLLMEAISKAGYNEQVKLGESCHSSTCPLIP
ncbi:hypothetical protein EON64_04905 [archaeon]|nr:MAG: hypothetical protein EON64_04905 [archaeon]